jgi:hypothetical protein
MSAEKLDYLYRFRFDNGLIKEFLVSLNRSNLQPTAAQTPENLPAWTELRYFQCSVCPLKPAEHPHCPAAVGLVPVIETFKELLSFEEVTVEVVSEERTWIKKTPLQYGLSSLIGLCMATSGCPVLDRMRPMAATHRPFASLLETTYRTLVMYLMAQYFRSKQGFAPDWDLHELPQLFSAIQNVNACFHQRVSGVHLQDAGLNAIFRLDYSTGFTMRLVEDGLDEMKGWFEAYLK